MGYLHYGDNAPEIAISDRLLAHLKVVITTKLRRRESFTLTVRRDSDDASGRSSLWMQESIALRFEFDSPEAETLDQNVLRGFAEQATMSGGLTVNLDEWDDQATAASPALSSVA